MLEDVAAEADSLHAQLANGDAEGGNATQLVDAFCASARSRLARGHAELVQNVSVSVGKLRQVLDEHYLAVQLLTSRGRDTLNKVGIPSLGALIQEQVCEPLIAIVRNVTQQAARGELPALLDDRADAQQAGADAHEESSAEDAASEEDSGRGSAGEQTERRVRLLRGGYEI